jgi:EAL domain-containing protein (putative c-di-GMP-specific phosphodiesterase class I)
MAYQPMHQVREGRIVGFESLARFSTVPLRTPDVWFREAAEVGLGVSLEIEAVSRALAGLSQLPPDIYVSINSSPDAIIGGDIPRALRGCPLDRVVLEVTEHAAVERYADLAAAIGPLRDQGLRVAVDDAGAGYASFRHILSLAPDIIKLDMNITRNIDSDRSRQALAAAFVSFAQKTQSKLVAEGVETAAELAMLRQLGIEKAQGYFLGKPMALANAVDLARGAGRAGA